MGSLNRPGRRVVLAVAVAAWLTGVSAVPAFAADPVTFGQPTGGTKFGSFIVFQQPVAANSAPTRVEILLSTPGSIGPTVVSVPADAIGGAATLKYEVDLADGHVVPNTTFSGVWRVTTADGRTWLGPALRLTYKDDRFNWNTLDGDVVRVHWYEGDRAFGAKALKIGDDAVAATAELLGVTESDPIDFFIYADQQPFYDALGPGTRENVGGQAHSDIRTLFALIAPAEIDAGWIESVVPHELTHVVFATAIDNPYHEPPHWLNEGLAVYLSDGYDAPFKAQVASAARDGSLMPLDGLAGAFPTTRDRFFLGYAESVSAVDRIVRVDGRDALVKLIRSYHDGVSDDQAFQAALGTDLAGFEAAWLTEIGATPPTRRGPQPAPTGPLPEGWGAPQPNPAFDRLGGEGVQSLRMLLELAGMVVLILVFAVGLRRMQRNAARYSGPPPQPPVSAAPPAPRPDPPQSPSWMATSWSLARDVDPPEEVEQAGPGGPSGPPER